MRDLVFKNLTSKDRSRRILLAKETIDEDGIHTRIQKHLIYHIQEVTQKPDDSEIKNELFIIKEKNTKLKVESFFIKMKSGLLANCNDKAYLINFLQSLKIELSPTIE